MVIGSGVESGRFLWEELTVTSPRTTKSDKRRFAEEVAMDPGALPVLFFPVFRMRSSLDDYIHAE